MWSTWKAALRSGHEWECVHSRKLKLNPRGGQQLATFLSLVALFGKVAPNSSYLSLTFPLLFRSKLLWWYLLAWARTNRWESFVKTRTTTCKLHNCVLDTLNHLRGFNLSRHLIGFVADIKNTQLTHVYVRRQFFFASRRHGCGDLELIGFIITAATWLEPTKS